MPLLLTKTGEKFGKSEGNALFLNNSKTPLSSIYDYFYNTSDDDI
jgi:tyrosyl-tRNA synthetase